MSERLSAIDLDALITTWENNPKLLGFPTAVLACLHELKERRASPTPPTTEGREDIVARLRNDGSSWAQDLFNEAAEEIDRLRKAAP